MKNTSILPTLRNTAISLLVTGVEAYSELVLSNNLCSDLIEASMLHLSDGVEENGEEDDEAVCSCCEMLLDAIGCCLPEKYLFSSSPI